MRGTSANTVFVDALRQTAQAIFRVAVEAADPSLGVRRALEDRQAELRKARRVHLVAFGKAAMPMARAALPFCRARLGHAVLVTNRENVAELRCVQVITGDHPLPGEGSIAGALAVEAIARDAGPDDLLLVLVSGGGSALLCAPIEGVTLADKIAVNDALIRSGAPIDEINAVRSALSRLKGGGLARLAAPARLLALVLSDVPGDDLAIIASGPTVPPRAGPDGALGVLRRYKLDERLPCNLIRRFENLRGRTTAGSYDHAQTLLVGGNGISVEAARSRALQAGWLVAGHAALLTGDVAVAAEVLHAQALAREPDRAATALVCGGETTVRVAGRGLGGRNQELALRFAHLAEQRPISRPWCFLSAGTDGRDGPTDAAGATVDAGSLARMRRAGVDPAARLADNDAYRALDASGDLLRIGATGTNVADIQVLLLG